MNHMQLFFAGLNSTNLLMFH